MDEYLFTLYLFCRNIYGKVITMVRNDVRHSLQYTKDRMDE